MRHTRTIIGSLAATLGLALLVAPTALGAFPGENGRITFMRTEDPGHSGPWQIWVASADLRQQTKITSGDANSGWPVWAPGGGRIAFDSDRADPDLGDDTVINDVFTMRPDGSDVVKLTRSDGFNADAAYSPDGTTVAFDSDRGDDPGRQSIYTMSAADGSHIRRVTNLPSWAAYDLAPRFSPDGRRIVFSRYKLVDRGEGQPPDELGALHVVDVDGSHLRRLTSYDLDTGGADWKPDGRSIVFETYPDHFDNDPGDIYTIRQDGSQLTNLTHNTGATGDGDTFRYTESSDPVWSPDGRTIVFTNDLFVAKPFFDLAGLATMKPNGQQRSFVPGAQHEHEVDWESLPKR